MPALVIAIAHVDGLAGAAHDLRELLGAHQDRVAKHPGCRAASVSTSLADPDHYVVLQEWESIEALREFMRSPAHHDVQWRMIEMTATPWRFTVHTVGESVLVDEIAPMDPRAAD